MTSGSFDEAQLGKLDEVEWTMLTPSALKPGLWENMVVCGALLSRQATEQTPARYTQTPMLALQEGQHSQCHSVHKMAPNGPREKHSRRLACLGMPLSKPGECYAWRAWTGFRPTTSLNHILSPREGGRRERQSSNGKDLPWSDRLAGKGV